MKAKEVEIVKETMDDMFKESLADWERKIHKANTERDHAVEECQKRVKAADEAAAR